MNEFSRAELLLGLDGVDRLKNSAVMIVGVDGVGTYAAEALARCGVGKIILVDGNSIDEKDIKGELNALNSTIGSMKVDATKARILDINRSGEVVTYPFDLTSDNIDAVDFSGIDAIIDTCTDDKTVSLAKKSVEFGIAIISCYELNDKTDPTSLQFSEINKIGTNKSKLIAKSLRDQGVKKLKLLKSSQQVEGLDEKASFLNSFVLSSAGLISAGEIVKTISGKL